MEKKTDINEKFPNIVSEDHYLGANQRLQFLKILFLEFSSILFVVFCVGYDVG